MKLPKLPKADTTTLAWVLLGASALCLGLLQWAVVHRMNSWTVLPYVLIVYGAVGSALAGAVVGWRKAGRTFRETALLVVAVVVLVWLNTWCEPVKNVVAWALKHLYLWVMT